MSNFTQVIDLLEKCIPDMFGTEPNISKIVYDQAIGQIQEYFNNVRTSATSTLVALDTGQLNYGGEDYYDKLISTMVYASVIASKSFGNCYMSSEGLIAKMPELVVEQINQIIYTAYHSKYTVCQFLDQLEKFSEKPKNILLIQDHGSVQFATELQNGLLETFDDPPTLIVWDLNLVPDQLNVDDGLMLVAGCSEQLIKNLLG